MGFIDCNDHRQFLILTSSGLLYIVYFNKFIDTGTVWDEPWISVLSLILFCSQRDLWLGNTKIPILSEIQSGMVAQGVHDMSGFNMPAYPACKEKPVPNKQ